MKFPISNNSSNKDYTPEELFNLLAKESTGHYLLGNHNYWHGGIHFTNASVTNNQPVCCIADGVVVAYRLNKVYKESKFHQKEQGFEDLTLNYSSSFCLVKHEHKSISTRDPEEDVSTTVIWVGKYFILKKDRTVTDTSTLETKDADFVGTLKIGSKIKVLEVEEKVKINDNQKYRLAKVEIISMPTNANIVIIKPTEKSEETFKQLNNIVYIAIFDDQSEMVFINDKSVIEEYDPKNSWIGQTVKLSTEVKGVYRYLEETPVIENIINETITPTEVTPATLPTSEESIEVKYEATLPQGLQIKILAVNEIKADVQITRSVNGTLTKKPTNSTAPAETTITTGKTIAIELFQKNDKEEFITYLSKKSQYPGKKDIYEPIVETATDETSWNDQTVILYQDTQAREIDSATSVTLPEGTKLTIKEKSNKEADITQTKAKLVNDTNVTTDGKITTILADREVYVDLMDQYGNVLQNEEDKENIIAPTPNDKPTCNTLIYYSLYMHLLPGELYTDAQTLPNYYTKGKITAQVKLNGLQTYGTDQARTKGAKIQVNGKFTYDPSVTETITKDNNTLTVTQCTFVSGMFATNTTLKENEIFWAEIKGQLVKRISISPPDTDEVIDGCNIAIKEGDAIGYLGLYETPMPKSPVSGISPLKPEPKTEENSSLIPMPPTTLEGIAKPVEDMIKSTRKEFEKSSKSQVHLEIFVTDKGQLDRFMDNKAQIKTGNQYLKLSPNAVITLNQQQTEPPSTVSPSGVESSTQQPVAALTTNQPEAKPEKPVETTYTLLQEHILAIATLETQEDQGKTWYHVDLIDNKQSIKGRIEKEAANTKILTNHDWRELGFTIIEEEKDNADGFVDKGDMTPFFQNIYAELDDTDKILSDRAKLQKTLTDQHIRQHWSKLIGYHPSEWQYNDAKWSRLDQILKNKELLRHEKERIKELAFWDKVNEIKKTPKVCHIHPVAFYEYAPFALEKSDDAVVVITGKIKEVKKLEDNPGNYGKEIMLYKVLIYNNISYDNYLKYEKEGVLPKPTVTTLTRDSWNSSKRAIYRYGSSNETPPGTYYLLYSQTGFPSKNYHFKITEKSARVSDSITINGPNNKNIIRNGIRIHHYNSFYAEGCLTTGNMKENSITKDFFQKIPLFKSHPDSVIRIIIKERKAIKYDDNTYKGVL